MRNRRREPFPDAGVADYRAMRPATVIGGELWKRRSLDFWERWRRSGHSMPPRPRRRQSGPDRCFEGEFLRRPARTDPERGFAAAGDRRIRSGPVGGRTSVQLSSVIIDLSSSPPSPSSSRTLMRMAPHRRRAALPAPSPPSPPPSSPRLLPLVERGRLETENRTSRVLFFCALLLALLNPARAFSFAARCRCR